MTRGIKLRSRPVGWPDAGVFELAELPVTPLDAGQVRVRNLFMSVDPYMRGRMNEGKSYVPPFQVGELLDGGAVGEVVESRADGLPVGELVLHDRGWREEAVVDAARARAVRPPEGISPSAYLGVLGMPGLTAYVGLLDVAGFQEGDAVFVSGAAGAVGSLVGQIARLRGASRVVGSAGSEEKVRYLTEQLGFDAAFNYKTDRPLTEQLRSAAPDGIDVYFDNVGGDHLAAAIDCLHDHGRAALCGAISGYNETEQPPGPGNLFKIVTKRLTLRGFIVGDHAARMPDMINEMGDWLRTGAIRFDETVVEGIENAPEAFLGMLRGENRGKMIVKLA
ncbi:NADP-dependent oxidoreductase [Sphaerisporangium rufum]|uniref:NADP-dependent oxidoreductase n=1 Tax=Sphaerisporangium rufum TaxID=1381558 RepID=A0A919QYT6_9ACTN|nr:NADP-dependent oxidoreductase [Sphaerisporangium rufum]GII76564.1 NADP-dependent oxidoreductase [Sphaerisporangium rufum]